MIEVAEAKRVDAQVERFYECASLVLKQARYKEFGPGELWVALRIVKYVLEREQGVSFPDGYERRIDEQVARAYVPPGQYHR